MRNRRTRRRHTLLHDLPLTPLIDTALTLLIIFMITSPMIHNAIKVNLPQGSSRDGASTPQQIITVSIDDAGAVYLNDTQMALEEIITSLSPEALEKSEGTVHVKADKQVHYGRVMQVVDTLKVAGGVRYVALATQRHA